MKGTKIFILVIASFFCFTPKVQATHLAGVEIIYNFVSANTAANTETYDLFVYVYRDINGNPFNLNAANNHVCVTSSCANNSQDALLTYWNSNLYNPGPTGIGLVPNQEQCAVPSATDPVYEVHCLRGTVTITGKCADWRFQWNDFARNNDIDNLVNPGGRDLFGIAMLNNQIGPNSSPSFIVPAAKRFCVLQPTDRDFVWSQASTEPDGDSIHYKLGHPEENGAASNGCLLGSDIPFAAGYTVNNPITTHNGIVIDRKNGTFRFKAAQAEDVVIRVDVEEWRFNSTTLAYELVGQVSRDMQVSIVNNCTGNVLDGPNIDAAATGTSPRLIPLDSIRNILGAGYELIVNNDTIIGGNGDTLMRVPTINYNCANASVQLVMNPTPLCESIEATDFDLRAPDGQSRPVFDVQFNCDPNLTADTLNLVLGQALDINGPYLLRVKRGNLGHTLYSDCSYELVDNFYYLIDVTNCPELDYEITNVTVQDDKKIKIEYDLDPLSYYSNTFTRIDVLRANNDQNFVNVGQITDQTARSFVDNQLDAFSVDNQAYQYILQMVTNSNPRLPTNFVNSILLTGVEADGQLELEWVEYLNDTYGAQAEYEVFVGDSVTIPNDINWVSLQNTGITRDYTYTIPENGRFWLKVEGTDPSNTNTLIAESNWVEIGSSTPPPPPIVDPVVTYVPNIITPNNDGINDRFYFSLFPQNVDERPYSNVELSIFNRWGRQVFYDDNYMDRNNETDGWDGTDQNTGSALADGVYFYVAKFSDVSTGKSEERNGSVTLGASL